ncbi:tetratricopeptide repeat protein [Thermotoga sp. Mc24]|uniref:tetratricopeptide repeat protein n=1 Tax=Thermotoga sp. Mc24 TaxID=1231241 RepID=UPI00056F4C35|nr:tetratricopeptide repeat protein [Thermotoga sp. Mc24]
MAVVKGLILIFIVFSLVSVASDLYSSALNAYLEGDYRRALELFENALREDPTIEERDPLVKLKMGICAYATGDYEKARAYLSNFPDNVVAQEILKRLSVPEEVWKKYIETEKAGSESKKAEATNSIPFWLPVVVSAATFLSVFYLQRLLMKRLAIRSEKKSSVAEGIPEVFEELPEDTVEEISEEKPSETFAEKLDFLEELLGKVQESNREGYVDIDEVKNRARKILENSAEVPDDLTAEEVNLDVEEVIKELEEKEAYDEKDARKLVLAAKKKLREE